MKGIETINELMTNRGYSDFKWIAGKDVVVAQFVKFKCMFGCPTYGTKGSCPPNVPSLAECAAFFKEYDKVAVIHVAKKMADHKKRHEWTKKVNNDLLKLERDTFIAGYHKAFLLFMDECSICKECPGTRADCKNKAASRPCPEGLGVDVFTTVRKCGFNINVLPDYEQEMNRYAFLLVE